MVRMTVIAGGERRRRWSAADRSRILAAISQPGVIIADVARREDVCTSLVYKWRRATQQDRAVGGSGFSPVIVGPATDAAPTLAPALACGPASVEIDLPHARVKIAASAPVALVVATLKALRS